MNGEKLYYELFRSLTKGTGSEVKLKARVSTGLTFTSIFGGFGVKEAAEMEIN